MKQNLQMLVLGWLRWWAKLQLRKYAPDIIGITGSAGKTSCRNAVYAILQDKYKTKMTDKANSESGIPLDILGIQPGDYSLVDWVRMCLLCPIKLASNWQPYDKYIVEMGIDSPTPPKNMEYLLTIIRPRTAIWLNALPVHTAYFEDGVEGIAREKGKLIASLPKNGLAILNADDERVMKVVTKAQVMTFGVKGNEVKISDWEVDSLGTSFKFNNQSLKLPQILPEHFGYTLAAALCIALDEDYTIEEGIKLLKKNFKVEPGRSSVFEGINGSTIIDSSYNASPQTMLDMLELLEIFPGKRKLALLGEMRELENPEAAHKQILKQAQNICAQVYTVGKLWGSRGFKNAAAVEMELKPGDVLLVKGSQNEIFLETAIEKLLANKNDVKNLCRRGEFWEKQRQGVGKTV